MADRAKRLQSAVLLFALTLLVFLITAIALSFLPQDLGDLEGRTTAAEAVPTGRNIQRVLENAESQDLAVTLTEEEVNQWLATQLKGTQGGLLKEQVGYRGVWVRFRKDVLEVIIERDAFNRNHTVALHIEFEQLLEEGDKMNTKVNIKSGRLGQLPVPEGYMLLVMSGYQEIGRVLKAEVAALKSMLMGKSVLEISEGKMTLTPRSSGAGTDLPGDF